MGGRVGKLQTQGGARRHRPHGTGKTSELLRELRRANEDRPYLRGYGDYKGSPSVIADYDEKHVRAKRFLGPVPATATKFEKAILNFTRNQKLRRYKNKAKLSSSIHSCVSAALERINKGCLIIYGEALVNKIKTPDYVSGMAPEMYVLADKFSSKKFTKLDKDLFEIIAYSRKPGGGQKTVARTAIDKKLWKSRASVGGNRALDYYGAGVAGALAILGFARLRKGSTIWNPNAVSLGSPLQFWSTKGKYTGHAGLLERYIYNEKQQVVGFCYSDQWYDYDIARRTKNIDDFGGFALIYAAKYTII